MPRLPAVLALALAAACAPDDTPAQAAPAPEVLRTIAEARAEGPGATVLVEGVVTVAPGVFEDAFAVQDRTGGIWVLSPPATVRLQLGDGVRIRGTLDVLNGQLALQLGALRPLGTRGTPEPRALPTGAVADSTEGWLVRVRGRVAGPPVTDSPWGWTVALDDGSGPALLFVGSDQGVDLAAFAEGAVLEVTGYAGRYEERLEILPRGPGDVRPVP